MAGGQVYVTVGTTKFDPLIQIISKPHVKQILASKGYSRLLMQIGNGQFEPATGTQDGISVDFYRFKDSLQPDIANADLVISHAGAGSCLEVLEAGKPLIVVVNEELMGNHQAEIADALEARRHVYSCTPTTLFNTLENSDLRKLKPFPPANPDTFINFLDGVMRGS